jgi:hypothetical protein
VLSFLMVRLKVFLPYILRVKSVTLSLAECYPLRVIVHVVLGGLLVKYISMI